ncbi:MAG: DUF2806 domain-containing protein [Sphingobacteriales bacterium]|nr:MAG: DUF2806 domain-containing protein [Sphingobacteriales bacterium]
MEKEANIKFNEILKLADAGLINSQSIALRFTYNSNNQEVFTTDNKVVIVSPTPATKHGNLNVYLFTKEGKELLNLISKKPTQSYIDAFLKEFKQLNVKVEVGDIIKKNEIIEYGNLVEYQWS